MRGAVARHETNAVSAASTARKQSEIDVFATLANDSPVAGLSTSIWFTEPTHSPLMNDSVRKLFIMSAFITSQLVLC